ncbi:unknown [Acinetobacter sp. CAG:196]|nr:unknown [Acinetobacter sp. CAG:196]
MRKKLYQSGNAWVLLIPKAILQLLDINPEVDEVELEVENKVLKVKKAEK